MRLLFTLLILSGTLSMFGTGLACAEELPPESAIKATYLYKFSPFVDWPASAFVSAQAPLNICVAGDPALTPALASAVASERDGQHTIAVREASSSAADCHILYVRGHDPQKVAQLLASVKGMPILTVTDLPQDSGVHGMVNFIVEQGHVRFDIDDAAAGAAGLSISSKLLGLARKVKKRDGP